jgi:hypothetical protein
VQFVSLTNLENIIIEESNMNIQMCLIAEWWVSSNTQLNRSTEPLWLVEEAPLDLLPGSNMLSYLSSEMETKSYFPQQT